MRTFTIDSTQDGAGLVSTMTAQWFEIRGLEQAIQMNPVNAAVLAK